MHPKIKELTIEKPHFLDNPTEGGNYNREYHTGIYRNEKTYP